VAEETTTETAIQLCMSKDQAAPPIFAAAFLPHPCPGPPSRTVRKLEAEDRPRLPLRCFVGTTTSLPSTAWRVWEAGVCQHGSEQRWHGGESAPAPNAMQIVTCVPQLPLNRWWTERDGNLGLRFAGRGGAEGGLRLLRDRACPSLRGLAGSRWGPESHGFQGSGRLLQGRQACRIDVEIGAQDGLANEGSGGKGLLPRPLTTGRPPRAGGEGRWEA
jgi:hypothetical protein